MNPLLIAFAVIGIFTAAILLAFFLVKEKKDAFGFDRNMKDSEIIRRLFRYAKPYLGKFGIALLLMILGVASEIASPLIIGNITDILGRDSFEYREVLLNVVLCTGVLLLSLTCMYFQATLLQKTGQRIISDIRQDTFEHIESLSHGQLNHIPVGTLVTRVTTDTQADSRLFTNIVVNLVRNVCTVFGIVTAMFFVNVRLTLMVLCATPFIVLFSVIFRKFSRRAHREVKTRTTDLNVFLSENLSGIKVTQIFNQEDEKLRQFREKNTVLQAARFRQIFVFGIFRPCIYMLYLVTVLCLFWMAGTSTSEDFLFLDQAITYPTVVIFYQYIAQFFTPVQNLAEQFNVLQAAFASAEKIFTILDIVPEVQDAPDAMEVDSIEGRIEFRDVWFAYKPNEWVLKGVSFTVLPRQTVAFVGATGAGKSTVLSLICRNYDIQKGQILIDGIDIKKYKISSLRRHFGQMLQDVFLFSGTVRSNIVLCDEDIPDEAVRAACHSVNADSFIDKLKNGLDEEVRERGGNFSAGQRQLISFARTVVHQPEVMILDEATANIDTETEQLIQNSLAHMMNVSTMLIVAHRLSTIQHADNVLVMSHGEIAEQGTHQELLKLKGMYYRLYQLQFEKERLLSGTGKAGAEA